MDEKEEKSMVFANWRKDDHQAVSTSLSTDIR